MSRLDRFLDGDLSLSKEVDKAYGKQTNKYQKSSFLITLNPNISYLSLDTKAQRVSLYKRLVEYIEDVKEGLDFYNSSSDYSFVKMLKNNKICINPLQDFQYAIEIGKKKGYIHVHMLAVFKCPIHINQAKLRAFSNEIRDDGEKVHLNIKYIHNPLNSVLGYISKDKGVIDSGSV